MTFKSILTVLLLPLSGLAQEMTAVGRVFDLSAPPLGITSSSVVLLWDDTYVPDYTSTSDTRATRVYHIYQNGVQVGTTERRSYPVTGLSDSTTYTFTVQLSELVENKFEGEQSVRVTTRKAGEIFDVRKYGAKGDGKTRDTKAIQDTINACTPGGTVLIPAGNYLVDHLQLKSDLTLELRKDARLNFLGYQEGGTYPLTQVTLSGPNGDIDYETRSLIGGYKIHDVAITGEGTIDGNGETWWPHYKSVKRRPFTIELIRSSHILVQGIIIQDPPAWNNHLLYVDDAVYSNVKFFQVSQVGGHNGDGLNPDSSRNILIVGCLFGNQDDSIAIKSGTSLKGGSNRQRSSEFITIRDCTFDGNAAPGARPLGCAIGSETSGGARHIVIKNCEFIDAASIVGIKTNRRRPFAVVEDVRVENIRYTNSKFGPKKYNRAPISVDFFYYAKEGADPSIPEPLTAETPVFRNIHFNNISIHNTVGRGIYLSGLPESPIHDISLTNLLVRSRDGIIVHNTESLTMQGITVLPTGPLVKQD